MRNRFHAEVFPKQQVKQFAVCAARQSCTESLLHSLVLLPDFHSGCQLPFRVCLSTATLDLITAPDIQSEKYFQGNNNVSDLLDQLLLYRLN